MLLNAQFRLSMSGLLIVLIVFHWNANTVDCHKKHVAKQTLPHASNSSTTCWVAWKKGSPYTNCVQLSPTYCVYWKVGMHFPILQIYYRQSIRSTPIIHASTTIPPACSWRLPAYRSRPCYWALTQSKAKTLEDGLAWDLARQAAWRAAISGYWGLMMTWHLSMHGKWKM